MYSIYIIKNKNNGNFYIGQTNDFEKRIKKHFSQLTSNTHHSKYLQKSFNKHGKDSFEYGLLYENLSKYEADLLEEELIEEYYDDGVLYNVSKKARGGDLLTYHPNRDEIIEKIKVGVIKRWQNMTDEELQSYRERFSGENNHMYGRNHTYESKLKISESLKGRKFTKEQKEDCSKRMIKRYECIENREKARNNTLKRYEDINERKKTSDKSLESSRKKKEEGLYNQYKYTKYDEEYEFIFNGKYYKGIESCVIDTGYNEKIIKKKLLSEKPLDIMNYLIYDPIEKVTTSGGKRGCKVKHTEETINKIRNSNLENLKSNYFIEFSNGEKLRFDYKFELKNHLIELGMKGTTIENLYKSGKEWNPKKYEHKHLTGLKVYKIE